MRQPSYFKSKKIGARLSVLGPETTRPFAACLTPHPLLTPQSDWSIDGVLKSISSLNMAENGILWLAGILGHQ
jgi:hypothetical protein